MLESKERKTSFASIAFIALAAFLYLMPQQSVGQDLIYTPRNPAFGGNPLNFSNFLNAANAQNKFQGNNRGFGQRNPLEDFERSLQRQILSQLTRDIINNQFGSDLNLQEQNTLEFGEFSIDINPGVDGVSISIRNILTGESTDITIPTNF